MIVDDVAGLRRVLQDNRVIAVVGLSPNWQTSASGRSPCVISFPS